MKKRMLSLLLALVMTLSLCVPALAADEFAAEAVTEVEEQAPVAPEAPAAPEAEEPVEEPVVDEPAAEEPVEEPVVEDVPEMASIMPEELEDEPLLVTLGVVTGTAHYKLEKAIAKADELMPKVEAGELYVKASYDNKPLGDKDYAPAKAFLDAYAVAKKNLDAINGVTVDINVNTKTVEAATEELKKYLPKDDGTYQLLTDELIGTSDSESHKTNANALFGALKAGNSYNAGTTTYNAGTSIYQPSGSGATYAAGIGSVDDTTKFNEDKWTLSYKADYLKALKDAQDAIEVFSETDGATFKDFSKAAEAVLAAAKLEADAAKAGETEANALAAVIKAAEAIKTDYAATKDGVALHSGEYANYDAALYTKVDYAKKLLSDTQGLNGLADKVKYYDVQKAIKDITDATTPVKRTIQIEKIEATADNKVTITVSIANVAGFGTVQGDGVIYGIGVEYDGYWFGLNNIRKTDKTFDATNHIRQFNKSTGSQPVWKAATDDQDPNRLYATFGISPFDSKGDEKTSGYKAGDKVTFRLMEEQSNGSGWLLIKDETYEFPVKSYYGPMIESAVITNYNEGTKLGDTRDSLDEIKTLNAGTLTDLAGSMPTVKVTLTEAFADTNNVHNIYVKSGDTKLNNGVTTSNPTTNISGTISTYVTDKESKFTVSGLKATLDVNTDDAHKTDLTYEVQQDSVALSVKPLSAWGDVKTVNKILDEAAALVAGDYELDPAKLTDGKITDRTDLDSVDDVIKTINQDVTKVRNTINNASLANTSVNRKTVLTDLEAIAHVYAYLKVKAADTRALVDLQREIRSLKEDDYTYDSWGKMQDANEAATKVLTNTPILQSKVNKAYNDLKAAVDALVNPDDVDKTGLEASITAAEALKEEDYTPESWTAAKENIASALATAKNVAADENASQTMVDNAKKTLDDAMAKLEELVPVDKTALEAAIAAAKALNAEDYTEESWAEADIAAAIEAAQAVADDEDATQEEVDAAVEALAAAVEKLVEVEEPPVEVDKSELELSIEFAGMLDEADYTAESWAAMQEALEAAQAVYDDEEATQDEVDAADEALTDAINALEEVEPEEVDKSALMVGIVLAQAVVDNPDEFTAESVAALAEALEAAQAVFLDEEATQEEVDAAVEALADALNALEEKPEEPEIPAAPSSGTGWVQDETTGDIYFYQNNQLKKSFWVGKADGASKWDGNWYYVGADGKLVTGMAYLDDLHGGYGWYFLQPTNKNGEIGKMLTGWQWVGGAYGTCYFSTKSGSSGKCTYSTELGNWNGTTWAK